jgi:DNA-directed RNA polymerase subunit F
MAAEILNSEPLTLAETKTILEKIKERDSEFGFRSGRTYEYLTSFQIMEEQKAQELKKKIAELNIPRLKPEQVAKIVDLNPESLEELKVMLQGVTITSDNLKKIEELLRNAS